MNKFLLLSLLFFSLTVSATEECRAKIYECSGWPDGTYNLHCGGAFIKKFKTPLECVQGRKRICGTSMTDFECNRWADGTFNLHCDGVFIAKYKSAIECVKAKREICD